MLKCLVEKEHYDFYELITENPDPPNSGPPILSYKPLKIDVMTDRIPFDSKFATNRFTITPYYDNLEQNMIKYRVHDDQDTKDYKFDITQNKLVGLPYHINYTQNDDDTIKTEHLYVYTKYYAFDTKVVESNETDTYELDYDNYSSSGNDKIFIKRLTLIVEKSLA